MFIMGFIFGCLDFIFIIVVGFVVCDFFIMFFEKKELVDEFRLSFVGGDVSDYIVLVRVYEGW